MKTKFTRIIAVLAGLFLLTAGARAQNQPDKQNNLYNAGFHYPKNWNRFPPTGKTNLKQAFVQSAATDNGQNSSNVELIGRWAYGPCYGVAVDSNYIYYGNGAYLEIANRQETGRRLFGKVLLPDFVNDAIVVRNHIAYVAASGAGLRIIDVRNPYDPKEIGYCDTIRYIEGIALSGNYAYITNNSNNDGKLRIVDISNLKHPVQVGFINLKGYTGGIAVSGKYAYVANHNNGLRIINISDPKHPVETGFFKKDGQTYTLHVAVSGSFAFVANDRFGLQIIDVSDPSHPKEFGSYSNSNFFAYNLSVSGNYAYVTDIYSNKLRVIYALTSNPFETRSFSLKSFPIGGISVFGQNVYIAGESELAVINVSKKRFSFFITGGYGYGLAVSGKAAFLAESGLPVLNLDDPSHPEKVGSLGFENSAQHISISGHYAYLANGSNLQITDINNLSKPVPMGSVNTKGRISGIDVSGQYVYLANGKDGLRIINAGDKTHPVETGSFDTQDNAKAVKISGRYACVADGSDGLRIIDISDPAHPVAIGYFDTEGSANGVTVVEKYAYVADGSDGLRIIDISNPKHPFEVGSYDTEGNAVKVTVSGQYAYVVDGSDGLRIVDISNPAQPLETGFYPTGGWGVPDVVISDPFIYLLTPYNGLYVLKLGKNAPFTPVWHGNPYQPMTLIVKSAFLYGDSLQPGDEIGIFTRDSLGNEICMGDSRVYYPISNKNPLVITIPSDDPTTTALDGFKNGSKIYYKIWNNQKQKVYSNVSSVYDTSYDCVFNKLGTAVVNLFGYGHYQPVWNGNPYQPMDILIDSIILPGTGIQPGDEVGLFDKDSTGNEICVGTGTVSGTLSSKQPLSIVASADDPTTRETDGFLDHHKMIFKIWPADSLEYSTFSLKFDPAFDSLFTPLGTALVKISFKNVIPVANAGKDDTICENKTYTLQGTAENYSSVVWRTSGNGTFSDSTSLNAVYTPGKADIAADSAVLTLQANPLAHCDSVTSDNMVLYFKPMPEKPQTPQGPGTILQGTDLTTDYTIPVVKFAKTYTWGIYPDKAGTIAGNDTTGTVTWNSNYTGTEAYVFVTVSNGSCGSVSSDSLKVRLSPVGIPQHADAKNILVAPNPSRGRIMITLKNNTQDYKLAIINTMGRLVLQKELNTKNNRHQFSLNLGVLPAGIYYLRFVNEKGIIIKKILINK